MEPIIAGRLGVKMIMEIEAFFLTVGMSELFVLK